MSKANILIVEDENIVAMDIKSRLERLGYRVSGVVNTGEKSFDACEGIPPDLVLMDIKLKGNMDGIAAARKIREQFNIPVVYLTAYADELTIERAKVTAPLGYIMKPVEERELRTAIEIALHKHQLDMKLRESEERYRTILDSIDEGYFEVDLRGKFTFVSDSFCKIAGDSKEILLQRSNRDYMDEETSKRIYWIFNQIYRTGNPATGIEHEITTTKGERKYHELSASLMRDQNGKPIGFRGIVRDIGKRKEVEEALLKSEERFREMANNIREVFWLFDWIEQKVIYVSPAYEEIWGRSIENLYENYAEWGESIHPDDLTLAQESFARIVETGGGEPREYRIVRPDGTVRWISDKGFAITDEKGQVSRIAGIAEDITERRNVEEALHESEAKYRQMVEYAPTGIYEMDLSNFGFTKVNDVMCEVLGFSEDEFLSMDPLELLTEKSKKLVFEKRDVLLSGQNALDTFEYKLKAKDGREIWAQVNARIIYEGDKPVRALCIAQDVTERKALEEQLLLSRQFQAISGLAGGIAHEINNALMGILGNIELLMLDMPQDVVIEKYLEPIKASTTRMARLANQLLAYAEGGKYHPKTISMIDLVHHTLPLITQTADPAIRLETDFPKDILGVKVDVPQMQMVVSALIQNSLEAVESEGRIRIRMRNTEISPETTDEYHKLKPGQYVSFTVEDDGAGMDEETKARVFDPFFSTKFQGRGLSMAAVYGIVRNHGGWTSIESELGKGTTITVYLPAGEVDTKVEKSPKSKSAIKGRGTVLVIEDEEIAMSVIRNLLEVLGYHVLEAKTGTEAISIAESYTGKIDLAVLDIKLPDISGEKVYRIISESRPQLKVLVCSGYSVDGPVQRILDSGAQGFLPKPFSLETLSDKLEEIMARG